MKLRAYPIWRRRRFVLAAAKRFWSLGVLALIPFWFSATATSSFETGRHFLLGAIALANYGIYVYYEVLENVRSHAMALRVQRYRRR